jgi:exodeoxyribonuclease V alpha subunit
MIEDTDNGIPQTDLGQMFNLPKAIAWDAKQVDAINACCDISRRIVAVTGPAGTGKTMLIREISKRLSDVGYISQASAPTGKAAKRIREATGLDAMTNHRMLGYGMPEEHEEQDEKTGRKRVVRISTGPRYRGGYPMPYDTILCDEYAMVNTEINRSLINALKSGARICMFGDVNQLKPIEENKSLESEPSPFQQALLKFTSVNLDANYRQSEGSGIAENGRLILQGKMPRRRDDFDIMQTNEPVKDIQTFITNARDAGHDYSDTDHQIITAMNKSWIGTKKLNLVIQSMFWHRDRPYIELPRHKAWGGEAESPIRVQVGSKVVYTANTYDLGNEQSVFNGEVGIVCEVNHDDGTVDIDLGDRMISVPPWLITVHDNGRVVEGDPRRNIDLAYVLTTHKMQGSEVKHVCYIMNKSTIWVQSRRNFYTGITRAQQHCTVITDMVSLTKSTKFQG